MLTFDAVEETRKMAGDNHSAAIGIMKAEVNERLAVMDGKFEVLATSIANIKWTILVVASVSTVILAAVSIAVSYFSKS